MGADVGSLLCMCSHVSKSMVRFRVEDGHLEKKQELSYRLRCSKRLKRRPQVGMGQEWDF